jgi:hypothetical protein
MKLDSINPINIIDLVTIHQILLRRLIAKKGETCWLEYKQTKVRSLNYAILDQAFLDDYFSACYRLKMPSEIAYFYTEIGCLENDFTRHLKESSKGYGLGIDLSEAVAQQILKTYFELSTEGRTVLTQELIADDPQNQRDRYSSEIAFLLRDCGHFSLENDTFQIRFLQRIYEAHYHPNLIVKTLLCWAHCGGGGAIVLNTDTIGFDRFYSWDDSLTTCFEGVDYAYSNQSFNTDDRHHLEAYRLNIEADIQFLTEILKKEQQFSV